MVAKSVFFGICFVFVFAITIFSVYEEMPFFSAASGFLCGIIFIFLIAFLSINEETYNYAIIELPDKSIVEGELNSYDYLNDRIKVIINGTPYEVDGDNCTLFVR